jgi:hypothetical protein
VHAALCVVVGGVALLGATHPASAADPTTADCLAASESSLQLGNQHKLRAERSQLLVCAAAMCPADIRKECEGRVAEVNAQMPTVVFSARDATGDLTEVRVTMDGALLAARLDGAAISVDPGEHTFTFQAAGQPVLQRKLVIIEGQKDRRELIQIGPEAVAPQATSLRSPESTPAAPRDEGLGTQRILAIVAGGVGVAGIGLGTAFGILAISRKSSAQSVCPGSGACPTQEGADRWSSASTAGTLSTVGFVVGGVGLAGGAALWFTAPYFGAKSDTNGTAAALAAGRTRVGIGPGTLQLAGSF